MSADFGSSLSSTGIESRVRMAVSRLGFTSGTTVQSSCIPVVLEGHDVLLCAPTGTGKTLAYGIPLVNKVLLEVESGKTGLLGVVIVPSEELCLQVYGVLCSLTRYCATLVTVEYSTSESAALKSSPPSILVVTYKSFASLSRSSGGKKHSDRHVSMLVIDEADTVFAQQNATDACSLLTSSPLLSGARHQSVLVSATLPDNLQMAKGLLLNNPKELTISEEKACEVESGTVPAAKLSASKNVKQYAVSVPSKADASLVCLGLLKFELLKPTSNGKMLILTETLDEAYRALILLQTFGVSQTCRVYDSNLPEESRSFLLSQFNSGEFQILIVPTVVKGADKKEEGKSSKSSSKKSDKAEKQGESAVRGIDYRDVSYVFFLGAPRSLETYIHGVGRAGRAGRSGISICATFPGDGSEVDSVREFLRASTSGIPDFSPGMFETIRYRFEDVIKSMTQRRVDAVKAKEVFAEMFRLAKASGNPELIKSRRSMLLDAMEKVRTIAGPYLHIAQGHLSGDTLPAYIKDRVALDATSEPIATVLAEPANKNKSTPAVSKSISKNAKMRNKYIKRTEEAVEKGEKVISSEGDNLAPISGRKLWKIRHGKKLQKNWTVQSAGRHSKDFRRSRKASKKFQTQH